MLEKETNSKDPSCLDNIGLVNSLGFLRIDSLQFPLHCMFSYYADTSLQPVSTEISLLRGYVKRVTFFGRSTILPCKMTSVYLFIMKLLVHVHESYIKL